MIAAAAVNISGVYSLYTLIKVRQQPGLRHTHTNKYTHTRTHIYLQFEEYFPSACPSICLFIQCTQSEL